MLKTLSFEVSFINYLHICLILSLSLSLWRPVYNVLGDDDFWGDVACRSYQANIFIYLYLVIREIFI